MWLVCHYKLVRCDHTTASSGNAEKSDICAASARTSLVRDFNLKDCRPCRFVDVVFFCLRSAGCIAACNVHRQWVVFLSIVLNVPGGVYWQCLVHCVWLGSIFGPCVSDYEKSRPKQKPSSSFLWQSYVWYRCGAYRHIFLPLMSYLFFEESALWF